MLMHMISRSHKMRLVTGGEMVIPSPGHQYVIKACRGKSKRHMIKTTLVGTAYGRYLLSLFCLSLCPI